MGAPVWFPHIQSTKGGSLINEGLMRKSFILFYFSGTQVEVYCSKRVNLQWKSFFTLLCTGRAQKWCSCLSCHFLFKGECHQLQNDWVAWLLTCFRRAAEGCECIFLDSSLSDKSFESIQKCNPLSDELIAECLGETGNLQVLMWLDSSSSFEWSTWIWLEHVEWCHLVILPEHLKR